MYHFCAGARLSALKHPVSTLNSPVVVVESTMYQMTSADELVA